MIFPTPAHEISIVSAGQSSAGRAFVAEVGGYSFAMAAPERLGALAADLKKAGRRSGKRVGTYALMHLVADESDDKAWQTARDIAARGDLEAIRTMLASAELDSVPDGTTAQIRQVAGGDEGLLGGEIEVGNMAFMSFPALVGSYQSVAQKN